MLDARYFREQLSRDIAAVGERVIVEVRLRSGQSYRVRSVLAVDDGYVTLERYQRRADEAMRATDQHDEVFGGTSAHEVDRAIVPYESVLDLSVTPGRPSPAPRIGFHAGPYGAASARPD